MTINLSDMMNHLNATFTDHSSALVSDTANDMIHSFGNGLGISLVDGFPVVVSILKATAIVSPTDTNYHNGKNEITQLVKRSSAIRFRLAEILELILSLSVEA